MMEATEEHYPSSDAVRRMVGRPELDQAVIDRAARELGWPRRPDLHPFLVAECVEASR